MENKTPTAKKKNDVVCQGAIDHLQLTQNRPQAPAKPADRANRKSVLGFTFSVADGGEHFMGKPILHEDLSILPQKRAPQTTRLPQRFSKMVCFAFKTGFADLCSSTLFPF